MTVMPAFVVKISTIVRSPTVMIARKSNVMLMSTTLQALIMVAFLCSTKIRFAAHFIGGVVRASISKHSTFTGCNFFLFIADPTDEIVSTKQSVEQASDSKFTCQFGKLKLNVGDELNNIKEGVTCVCDVPPMPHCVSDHYY